MHKHCATCSCPRPEPGAHSQECIKTHAHWREVWQATRGETVMQLIEAANAAEKAAEKCKACLKGGRP